MLSKIFVFFVATFLFGFCVAANILYVVPFSAKSHQITLRPLGLELAQRGHNVTVITTNREANPPENYHQVIVDNKIIWDLLGGKAPNIFTTVDLSAETFYNTILWPAGVKFTEVIFNSSEVKHFLKNDNKYDLVISEQFFQEAMHALAHKYQTPLALISTFGNCMRHNIATRNPLQISTVLSEYLNVKDPKSFYGRLRNWYFSMYEYVWWRYWYLEQHEELVKKYLPDLPKPVPSLYELQRNTSLFLSNSHFSYDTPVAYLPNIVEIGGIHLTKDDGKLPKDLQKILDDATNGVIYVNFGSNLRSVDMPEEKKIAFINVFKQLKQTVLWKWEDDKMDNKPPNLIIRNWMPQKEILSHPNIKVFIAHGGLIGTQEAIFHGVPIIGIPIYADQYNNLLQVQEIGFGKLLPFNDINEATLGAILKEVLINKAYLTKAKEVSRRFKDRPMDALTTAVFWVEYVIRNKGAGYMKSAALDLSWIEYSMVDVYLFVIAIILVMLYIIGKIAKLVISICISNNEKPKRKKH